MDVLEAAVAGATAEEIAAAEVPATYKAAYVEKDDVARLWPANRTRTCASR